MQPEGRDPSYLWDMIRAARLIGAFTTDMTEERFEGDLLHRSAVERQLMVLGEAARRVSSDFKKVHPEIPWRGIIALRNLVTHEYQRVSSKRVWRIATAQIPELVALLRPLVPETPEDDVR